MSEDGKLLDTAGHFMEVFDTVADRSHFAIAGGMPRDLILGKPIRDLDFILYPDHPTAGPTREQHAALTKLGLVQKSGAAAYSKKNDKSNFLVYGFENDPPENFVDAQVIIPKVYPHVFVEQTFDIGICQALMDYDGQLWTTTAFRTDAKEKYLTLMNRETISAYQLGYSIKEHIPRLKKKYPYEFRLMQNPSPLYTKLWKHIE